MLYCDNIVTESLPINRTRNDETSADVHRMK